jgi:hypothetical protein
MSKIYRNVQNKVYYTPKGGQKCQKTVKNYKIRSITARRVVKSVNFIDF